MKIFRRFLPAMTGFFIIMAVCTQVGAFDVKGIDEWPPIDSKEKYVQWMLDNTDESENFIRDRWERMQIDLGWYPTTTSKQTTMAFLRTPREYFVREYNLDRAYDSMWLMIEDGQSISGPHIVLRMTETILPEPEHKVLEIGTGSGYQSSILSWLSNNVYTIEIKNNLFGVTEKIYDRLENDYPNLTNITRKNDDGYFGWKEHAPFDRIIVTCAVDHVPPELLRQLKPNGIMVIPVGPIAGDQVLLKITKKVDENGVITLVREDVYNGTYRVKFVPFTKSDGSWRSND